MAGRFALCEESTMSYKISTLSSNELDEIRIVPISQSNKAIGIKKQLGSDWLWKKKYPIPVCDQNGRNYVRYKDLVKHLDTLFNQSNGDSK